MVEESSAVLNLPFEVKIPAAADHRKIVKHTYRDQRYHQIKDELRKIIRNIPTDGRQRSVCSNKKIIKLHDYVKMLKMHRKSFRRQEEGRAHWLVLQSPTKLFNLTTKI